MYEVALTGANLLKTNADRIGAKRRTWVLVVERGRGCARNFIISCEKSFFIQSLGTSLRAFSAVFRRG
jgi:hypothetical protein